MALPAGDDPAIGEPSAKQNRNRQREKCAAADEGHRLQARSRAVDEIKRQPGDQEIPEVVESEEPDECAPGGALAQNFETCRRVAVALRFGEARAARHPANPRRKPEQAAAPSTMKNSASRRARRASPPMSVPSAGPPAHPAEIIPLARPRDDSALKMFRDDFIVRGIGRRTRRCRGASRTTRQQSEAVEKSGRQALRATRSERRAREANSHRI